MKLTFVRSYPLTMSSHYNIQEIGLVRALSKHADVTLVTNVTDNTGVSLSRARWSQLPAVRFGGTQQLLRGIGSLFRELSPDVVIVGADNQLSSIATARVAKRLGAKVWLYQGVYQAGTLKERVLSRMMDLFLKPNVDGIFAKTYVAEDYMRSRGYKRIIVTGIGLDSDRFPTKPGNLIENRRKLFGDEHAVCLLHVGELSERRNARITLEVMLGVLEQVDNAVALVIGDGPYRSAYENRHPRLHFVGRIKQEEISQYYEATDILVNAYSNEIFGMSVLEGLYFGCHCYCSSEAPGPKYLKTVSPKQLNLVDSLNPSEWVQSIVQSIDTLKCQVRSPVSNLLEWDNVSKYYLEALQDLVQYKRNEY